jgi:hypothetical protein
MDLQVEWEASLVVVAAAAAGQHREHLGQVAKEGRDLSGF